MTMDMNRLIQSVNFSAMQARQALEAAQRAEQNLGGMAQTLQRLDQNARDLEVALKSVQASRAGGVGGNGLNPSIQRVENIPGRRVPFDICVDIPIAANVTALQQSTFTISQEGPFVCARRLAIFVSAYQFQVRDPENPGTVSTFSGRSFGRQRPAHSAWDLNDGQMISQMAMVGPAFPGTGAPHVISPSNAASSRSMQPDFIIAFENSGSSFPRQQGDIPSAAYSSSINDPVDLACLDVFERGEVLQWKVVPLHQNNPPFGNVFGFGVPNANYPFVDSGWDHVEGVVDANNAAAGATDPVTRLPNGILKMLFQGYRIVQPAGAGGGF